MGGETALFHVFLGNGSSYQNNISSVSRSGHTIKRHTPTLTEGSAEESLWEQRKDLLTGHLVFLI